MARWPDYRIQELLGIELPIIQAPMAGANLSAMAIAVSEAGGLGSLPCAMLSADQMRAELETIRRQTSRPINVNFFCHQPPAADPDARASLEAAPRKVLRGARTRSRKRRSPAPAAVPSTPRRAISWSELKPEVVSFHFGLPDPELLARVQSLRRKDSILSNHRRRSPLARTTTAATPSSPKATKPAAIAECF